VVAADASRLGDLLLRQSVLVAKLDQPSAQGQREISFDL